jgi:hypothetical protein
MMRDERFLRVVCFVCLLTAIGIDPLRAAAMGAQKDTPTNFEIIGRISAEAVRDIIAQIGVLRQGETVILHKAKSAGSVDFMMENAFTTEMRDAGIRLSVEAAERDTGAVQRVRYRLSYQIIRLSLSYPRVERKWWFGPREVTRSANATLFVQFINLATGDIAWVREINKSYRDAIDYSMLNAVEDAQYDFTRPPHSEFKMTRLFEPIVVGGIVIGLVYLFFSNQQD